MEVNKNEDRLGGKFGETYSLILTDPTFETRLKQFDPALKLMFDQIKKRWVVLEWAPDNSGWNIILKAEENGQPRALGEWVFKELHEMRRKYDEKHGNPDQFWRDLIWKADWQKDMIDTKVSIDHQHLLSEERNEWRRAWRELNNLPTSDVTAGYPRIHYRNGEIINP